MESSFASLEDSRLKRIPRCFSQNLHLEKRSHLRNLISEQRSVQTREKCWRETGRKQSGYSLQSSRYLVSHATTVNAQHDEHKTKGSSYHLQTVFRKGAVNCHSLVSGILSTESFRELNHVMMLTSLRESSGCATIPLRR